MSRSTINITASNPMLRSNRRNRIFFDIIVNLLFYSRDKSVFLNRYQNKQPHNLQIISTLTIIIRFSA